ncbi:MAG TPA: NAD(P)-dependent oxidoreductase [Acidimicrobiales bacterium]|jgi:phosphoglycerate dehydrogenase-like enzyme
MADPPTRPKVVVALALAPPLLDELAGCDLTMVAPDGSDQGRFRTALADADGVLVNSNVPVDRAAMAAAPGLRVISTMSVGLDHIDLEAAAEQGIVITNTPVLSDAVADLTMALMTMLSRRLPQAMRAVADGGWSVPLASDLAGKVLLLVGFGRIGRAVAARALAAGMRVRYVDTMEIVPAVAGVSRAGPLAAALPDADFVSLHVDLNAETRGLMGRREFALMKPTAYFVNTSRGAVVDQTALTEAVTKGEIAGAGLDVLGDEPPRPDDPLLQDPNVIIVPHIGSATTETRQAMAACSVDNLLMVLRGEGDPFVVAPRRLPGH